MKKQKNKQRGITLIALVVTIVVLIILAGVSMNMIVGENGIVQKAEEAKKKTEYEQRLEKEQMTAQYFIAEELQREKIEIKCNTLDYGEKNGVIRFSSNENTTDSNIVYIDSKCKLPG